MPARLHADHCRLRLAGWGSGECTCVEGRFQERLTQVRTRSGTLGLVVSIFRTTAGEIRFAVEADDGRLAAFAADQLEIVTP